MNKINSDIFEIANQASLKIWIDDKSVDVKHRLRVSDKSMLGVLLFGVGGAFFTVAPFIKTSDITTKALGITFGLFLIALSILTIIRQVADGITIENGTITFRHNLKLTKVPLDRKMKAKMKTEIMKSIDRHGSGSDYIVITHFLQDAQKETPILKFQMDNLFADNARQLGDEITRVINNKITASQTQ